MNRVFLGAALLFLSTQAACADESCDATFKQEGSVATGLRFTGQMQMPAGVSARSALEQFRVAASKEDFLMGEQTDSTLVFQQPANKKSRAFNSELRVTADGMLAVDVPLPSGMHAPAKAVAKVMCNMMAEVRAGAEGDALAAKGRAIPRKAIALESASTYDGQVREVSPKITNQIGDWWNIHGRGNKPERELIYADASSLKELEPDTFELTGMHLYESAESAVDYNVYTFRIHCATKQTRIDALYMTMRDGTTFMSTTPAKYRSAKDNWLSKVHLFACEPEKRSETSSAMISIGKTQLQPMIEATWSVWWEDGLRPQSGKQSASKASTSRTVPQRSSTSSFEGSK